MYKNNFYIFVFGDLDLLPFHIKFALPVTCVQVVYSLSLKFLQLSDFKSRIGQERDRQTDRHGQSATLNVAFLGVHNKCSSKMFRIHF